MSTEILDQVDTERLTYLEVRINVGLGRFLEVGSALLEIRDQRLYRAKYATFEDYCQERWSLTRRHINRMISACEVTDDLGPMGPKSLPSSERQIRPLAQLPSEQRAEAWKEAKEVSGKDQPPARVVKEIVDKKLGRPVIKNLENAPAHIKKKIEETFKAGGLDLNGGGKTVVNGVLQDDPPDVAALRAIGDISKDSVVKVDDVEVVVTEEQAESYRERDEERKAIQEDVSDEAYVESLPLYPSLADATRKILASEALLYRRMAAEYAEMKQIAAKAYRDYKHRPPDGPFSFMLRRALKVLPPQKWRICPPADDGGCGGTGIAPGLESACSQCYGSGFRATTER